MFFIEFQDCSKWIRFFTGTMQVSASAARSQHKCLMKYFNQRINLTATSFFGDRANKYLPLQCLMSRRENCSRSYIENSMFYIYSFVGRLSIIESRCEPCTRHNWNFNLVVWNFIPLLNKLFYLYWSKVSKWSFSLSTINRYCPA